MIAASSFPVALTIAGSDPSGGAGIQADLKTFHQHGVYGTSALTLLTVQNTTRVSQVETLPPSLVLSQIAVVLEDLPVRAAKTGALGNEAIVRAVAQQARSFAFPLVVDPVMVSKHGAPLLPAEAMEAVIRDLLPVAAVLMPNLPEAAAILGRHSIHWEDMEATARALLALGPRAVLLKGGHLLDRSTDLLVTQDSLLWLPGERVETPHTHGTGCSYSAAITARLALGEDLPTAAGKAKDWIHRAIKTNPSLGKGSGPINHFASLEL
ncbi:MAG: bifunctional hydroxymethylpyrimidine kinase/phosphomethylpyrimidine kinase [Bryobacter sp.]|nr:bifunctional hydroxymethylpyrimidine kinase/phosphomethylpyrimidine kinase [Bryobacter sp.]